MKMDITSIIKEARRLNAIIGNLAESKNSRNAAITHMGKLERESGFSLRRA